MTMERKLAFFCCTLLVISAVLWIKYSDLLNFERSSQNQNSPVPRINQYLNGNMFSELSQIRMDCGELCNTSRKGVPGLFFDQITAKIDCQALFKNEFIDKGHNLPHSPKEIPEKLVSDFTMNNRLKVTKWYFDQTYFGKKARQPVWTQKNIDDWVSLARQGKLRGNYGVSEANALRDGLQKASKVKNGRILVIGSENPWVEAIALEAGAREVVTLEYGKIISQHPQVKTLVPREFRMCFLNNTLGSFDGIVTFSSIEHSGLGRYGDALNPWGDIITIARAWCVTKPGGSLTIGIPFVKTDYIAFNAARFYGSIRYPYLTTNWQQVYRGKGGQKVHVFKKPE